MILPPSKGRQPRSPRDEGITYGTEKNTEIGTIYGPDGPLSEKDTPTERAKATTSVSVAAYREGVPKDRGWFQHPDTPVGSVEVTKDASPSYRQTLMSRRGEKHGTTTEESGQGTWTGGAFDRPAHPPYISWVHVDKEEAPGRVGGDVLSTMLGHVVRETGSVPVADAALTPEGAKLSRGLAKRYPDIKGHPSNPTMSPTMPPISDYSAAMTADRYDAVRLFGRTTTPDENSTARHLLAPSKRYGKRARDAEAEQLSLPFGTEDR